MASDPSQLHANLARLLSPTTIAIVGANESLGMSNNAVLPMLEAGRSLILINPNRETVYGQPAISSLAELTSPVDAVLSLVNAERSPEVVAQASELGCGGVVIVAAGFVEMGNDGAALQQRLQEVAARTNLAVIGPNCSGFRNVAKEVNLFTGGRLDLASGGISVVSQSGFLVRAAMAACAQRALGVSIAVSSGNEAVCDLADYVTVLAGDSNTAVICLVIETIRRPPVFFAAVAAALAIREHGIIAARDIDDLIDKAQLFAQIPPERRRRVQRIGMITTSGGVAALATDLADDEKAPLGPLPELEPWVRERVPGDTVNPLDLTGFVMAKPALMAIPFR